MPERTSSRATMPRPPTNNTVRRTPSTRFDRLSRANASRPAARENSILGCARITPSRNAVPKGSQLNARSSSLALLPLQKAGRRRSSTTRPKLRIAAAIKSTLAPMTSMVSGQRQSHQLGHGHVGGALLSYAQAVECLRVRRGTTQPGHARRSRTATDDGSMQNTRHREHPHPRSVNLVAQRTGGSDPVCVSGSSLVDSHARPARASPICGRPNALR